ncbi:MAG TPA: hypothetical protein VIY51_27075 [Xanthobacteraceae bacterium]
MASIGSAARNWVEAIDGECPGCGEPVFVLAKSCPGCGAVRRMGAAGMMVAGALALLLLAIVMATVVVLGRHQLAAATEAGEAIGEPVAAGPTGDLSWLANAMSQCDAEAKADTGTLHFLVTPLTAVAGDLAPWRAKAINDSGDGILLRSDDTLDGLKRGTLRLYPADYDFGVLNAAGDAVYRWRPSMGVSKFAAADPGEMPTFVVQFRTAHTGSEPEQGGSFNRLAGSCHWVNVIIRN